jgi:hypothetical protein
MEDGLKNRLAKFSSLVEVGLRGLQICFFSSVGLGLIGHFFGLNYSDLIFS